MAIEIYRNSFSFLSSRYEEKMNGQCVRSGDIETMVVAEADHMQIRFYLSNIGNLDINDFSIFEFTDEMTELSSERISYCHDTNFPDPNEPVECQLFLNGTTISGIRFTLLSPLRVIEFYGDVIEIGQPKRHIYKDPAGIISAESIISSLKASNRFEADELMDIAIKQFNIYSDITTSEHLNGIAECLKLFVEVYKLFIEQSYNEDATHMLLPKVCFFISVCNLKMCNVNQAYAVAKEGLKKVDKAISDSLFSNLPPELLGTDDLRDLISNIEESYPTVKATYNPNVINPSIVDTSMIDALLDRHPDANLVASPKTPIYNPNIPGILRPRSESHRRSGNHSSVPAELPDMLVIESQEHQRYENEVPVMGIQKCLRTIVVEANKNGCEGYNVRPGDGYIVRIYNNSTAHAQMSAKPMRLVQSTESFIELRGYPLLAWSPFGWQPMDYSVYGFFIHYARGRITHCDLHMIDRNVRIEYRYTSPNDLKNESLIANQ